MIDVGGGYLDIPAVETAGFKMIDVSSAPILSNKFRAERFFIKNTEGSFKQ